MYPVQGYILCQLGEMDLAMFCIRQLAQLGVNNMSVCQQALVHSFLRNYDKVHISA